MASPMRILIGLILLVSLGLGPRPAFAQDPASGTVYTKLRSLRVPFDLGADGKTLLQLQLHVSTDFGRSWQKAAIAAPDQGFFRFAAERDGPHWFIVQTIDKNNRPFPANLDGAVPSMKLFIDSVPPVVNLQPLQPRGNEVGVAWQVQDASFNPNQLNAQLLEYRPQGAANWIPLVVQPGANQCFWNPNSTGPVDVRFQARDQAGNVGDASTRVSLASDGGNMANPWNGGGSTGGNFAPNPATAPGTRFAIDPQAERFAGVLNPPTLPELKLVNSRRISLAYDLKDVGPSRLSGIELWYTHDGRAWKKHEEPFREDAGKNLVFELEREGLYGITLIARSGVGLGERPPQSGDRPQLWIEVDLTKPVVALRGEPQPGRGLDKGKIKILWTASDRNLGSNPVTLKFAEQAAGPWTVIAE